MDMSQLSTKSPLGDNIDRIGQYVNVKRFDGLRVCGRADVPFEIRLEWSPDGLEKAIDESLALPADQWKTHKFEILMPFVRLHLVNKSMRPNKELNITINGVGGVSVIAEPPPDPEKKVKSPLRRFMDISGKQSKKGSPIIHSADRGPGRDDRMPEYIPEDVILIGGKSGRVQVLARGNPGDILTVGANGKLVWAPFPLGIPLGTSSNVSNPSPTPDISPISMTPAVRTSMLQSTSFGLAKPKLSFSSIPPPDHPAPILAGSASLTPPPIVTASPSASPSVSNAKLPSKLDLTKLGIIDPSC